MNLFYRLSYVFIILLIISCSKDSSTNAPKEFVAAGSDFLSSNLNEQISFKVVGTKEIRDRANTLVSQEQYSQSYITNSGIPKIISGKTYYQAGSYDNNTFQVADGYYFTENNAILGDDLDGNVGTALPSEVKVGSSWTIYPPEKLTQHSNCNIVNYLDSYVSANNKTYSSVIQVEVFLIDSSANYYDSSDWDISITKYNAYVYLAKGIGIVDIKTIDSYKLHDYNSNYWHAEYNKEIYSGTISRE